MATNAQKTKIANRALTILNAGQTDQAGLFVEAITDAQFADYTTVSQKTAPQVRLICMLYEDILKQVLEDIRPRFATRYADLGSQLMVDLEIGGWDYVFELPTDFLSLTRQTQEGDLSQGFDCEILHLRGYSHVVVGTDSLPYYCSTSVTGADANRPVSGGSYATYWTAMSDTAAPAAIWVNGTSYLTNQTGNVFVTNDLTDLTGASAYIEYLGYAQAGQSDEPQYWTRQFTQAFCTRLAAEMTLDSKDYPRRRQLLDEYESMKLGVWRDDFQPTRRRRRYSAFERRTRG